MHNAGFILAGWLFLPIHSSQIVCTQYYALSFFRARFLCFSPPRRNKADGHSKSIVRVKQNMYGTGSTSTLFSSLFFFCRRRRATTNEFQRMNRISNGIGEEIGS